MKRETGGEVFDASEEKDIFEEVDEELKDKPKKELTKTEFLQEYKAEFPEEDTFEQYKQMGLKQLNKEYKSVIRERRRRQTEYQEMVELGKKVRGLIKEKRVKE